jgi:outer membrane protein TolC
LLKKYIFALSLTTSLLAPVCAWAEALSSSVAQALTSHPQIKMGIAARAQAENNAWEHKAAFFPTLSVDSAAGRVRNNDDTTRAATANNGGAASWLGQGTVTLTQPIYSGMSDVDRWRGAKERLSAAEEDLSGREEDIALRAARAHLNLMRTRDLLALATQFLSDIESRQRNISLMVKEGAADQAEILQANEIQASARNTRLGYEEAYRQAAADYKEAVGTFPDSELALGESSWDPLIPATEVDAITKAIKGNPRLRSATKSLSAAKQEAQAERGSLMPHLDATMSYMKKDQDDVLGGEATSAQAMLRMGWNFSLGGGQIARIEKMSEQQKEAQARRLDIARSIEHEVRQKFTSMEIVDKQYVLLTDKEKASKDILDNFVSQFEAGKQSNLQLIAANAKVFEASASRIDAEYRRLLSRFELLNALGLLRQALAVAPAPAPQKG